MNINEHRVREFAYQIWESEGKPHGEAARHWEMAVKLAAAQSTSQPSHHEQEPKPDEPLKPLEPLEQVEPEEPDEKPVKAPKKSATKVKTGSMTSDQLIAAQQTTGGKATSKPKKSKTNNIGLEH